MPRVVPTGERDMMGTIPIGPGSTGDAEMVRGYVELQARTERNKCSSTLPYQPSCRHSWFYDSLLIADAARRQREADGSAILRGRDQGALDYSDADLKNARDRLRTIGIYRDLSSTSAGDVLHPSLPGYLQEIWGQAARATGTLQAALGTQLLSAGMVDTSSGVATLYPVPRLSGGSTVAVQAAQNTAVTEVDPTTTSNQTPVSTVAGQVDVSRQLFEFSRPGIDSVLADDLSRALAAKIDIEIVSGDATAGRTRGLLNWAGILSVAGTVTNAQTFLNNVWQAYSLLAGASGYGASDASGYLTILHPRRAAWLAAGVSGTLPPGTPLVPGQLVVSAGIPTALGAGTNEDVALIVEKSQVLLFAKGPQIDVREDVGSGTLTVRNQATQFLALLVKNATAVAKVTGLVAPSGF